MWFFISGHGTFEDDGKLVSSVAGVVERINKLVSVRAVNWRLDSDTSIPALFVTCVADMWEMLAMSLLVELWR